MVCLIVMIVEHLTKYLDSYFPQDLVALVHQQKTVVEEQAKTNEEQSVTIDKKSNLIQQLQAETAVGQTRLKT